VLCVLHVPRRVLLLAGTPADKLLQMLTDLLDGALPNLQDILLIQSSILEARDIYQPWRLGKQLLETKDLEVRACVDVCGRGVAVVGRRGALAWACDAGQLLWSARVC
jgi:hypothetical protein